MPEPTLADDPPPIPPTRPGKDDCCGGSCDPCIFDLYEDEFERYLAELRAWQERTGRCAKNPDGGRARELRR